MGAKDCLSRIPLKFNGEYYGNVLVFVDKVKEMDVDKTIKIEW